MPGSQDPDCWPGGILALSHDHSSGVEGSDLNVRFLDRRRYGKRPVGALDG